jgi:mRNA-degrading endonuclease RelE of RelBE toxin-antitoxin system
MPIFKQIKYNDLFKKDLKKLLKRFRSLEDDLKVFIDIQLKLFHKIKQDNGGIKQITGLKKEYPRVYKATKFACKSLKGKGGKSGIRLIYAYFEEEDIIEFIEMYYKGDQENEDSQRIKKYLSSLFPDPQ